MPTTFIPTLNQARPIDWPIPWSELPSKRNTGPVFLSPQKKKERKKKHETEITFTAPKEEERERGGENDESEIKDSFAAQKI